MTGQNAAWFNNSTGHVNTGSGDQINISLQLVADVSTRLIGPLHWSAEHFAWLKQRFEEPPGFGLALDVVGAHCAALVVGAPGSGRRTAALMLLVGDGDLREVRIRELGTASQSWDEDSWSPDLITPGEGLLVDLTSVADEDYEAACSRINAFLGVLHRSGAKLAIVDGHRRALHTDLERLTVEIARPPDGRALLRKYLKAEQLLAGGLEITDEQRAYLDSAPLRVMPRIITLIKTALREDPAASVSQCVERALRSAMKGAGEFRSRFEQLAAPPQRALLLSAALCNGLPVDAVYVAYRGLANRLRQPADGQSALARTGFVDQLRECGVAVGTDVERRIRFEDLDFDAWSLTYFWDGFPGLRKALADWVLWCVAADFPVLDLRDRAAIVGRFATQSLRTNRPRDVIRLAEALARQRARRGYRPLIAMLLAIGLDSEHHASLFRRYLYQKAFRSPKAAVSREYTSVLIELCATHVAGSHPEQALVRLHLFAMNHSPVGDEARNALLSLADRDERVRRRLVGRIAAGRSRAARLDADLFVAVITASGAAAGRAAAIPRRDYVAGWRLVIAVDTAADLAGHLGGWLEPCLRPALPGGGPAIGRALDARLRVLADAVREAFALQSRLERAAALWAAADVGQLARSVVAARLTYWIDHAAGVPDGDPPFDLLWKVA